MGLHVEVRNTSSQALRNKKILYMALQVLLLLLFRLTESSGGWGLPERSSVEKGDNAACSLASTEDHSHA